MDKKTIITILVISLIALASVTAVQAARRGTEDAQTVQLPAQEIGIAAIAQGASFIISGGVGPILILVIAFIIGLVVSHLLWGGF